jgi:hypothetical protein
MMAVLTVTVHLVHILSGYANKLALLDNFASVRTICSTIWRSSIVIYNQCVQQASCSISFRVRTKGCTPSIDTHCTIFCSFRSTNHILYSLPNGDDICYSVSLAV